MWGGIRKHEMRRSSVRFRVCAAFFGFFYCVCIFWVWVGDRGVFGNIKFLFWDRESVVTGKCGIIDGMNEERERRRKKGVELVPLGIGMMSKASE